MLWLPVIALPTFQMKAASLSVTDGGLYSLTPGQKKINQLLPRSADFHLPFDLDAYSSYLRVGQYSYVVARKTQNPVVHAKYKGKWVGIQLKGSIFSVHTANGRLYLSCSKPSTPSTGIIPQSEIVEIKGLKITHRWGTLNGMFGGASACFTSLEGKVCLVDENGKLEPLSLPREMLSSPKDRDTIPVASSKNWILLRKRNQSYWISTRTRQVKPCSLENVRTYTSVGTPTVIWAVGIRDGESRLQRFDGQKVVECVIDKEFRDSCQVVANETQACVAVRSLGESETRFICISYKGNHLYQFTKYKDWGDALTGFFALFNDRIYLVNTSTNQLNSLLVTKP